MKIKLDFKSVRLSAYFVVITSILISIIVCAFTFYILINTKNLVSEYESDAYKLRYSLSTVLIQSLTLDTRRNNFESTENMIKLLTKENLLAYIYVEDNDSRKVILGNNDKQNLLDKENQYIEIQPQSKIIGKYTVYFGIQMKDNTQLYNNQFRSLILNIALLFFSLGVLGSFIMSGVIVKPIARLCKAAKDISDGNFETKIEKTHFTEINELIHSYNEMTFQLNELYSSLELKVQERTIALEEANYKLQETQAMMVHSEKMRSLGELVAGIAHEINNPVNFIHGNIMILKNYADDLMRLISLYEENNVNFPEDIKTKIEALKKEIDLDFLKDDIHDLIKSCIEGTQRTKNIVLDLKNFSRMEEMVLTQFDIPKEIDTTLNILNNKYKNRITVVKNYAQDLPKIEAYGGQLNQVFMNILDNAQDAMGDNGLLTINVTQEDVNVKIQFIDNGKGIPQENLNKIFDPFFTTKAVGKGTGLGMSISYRVIKDHKGNIEVESEVGKGTKFTITLPINHEEQQNV